MATTPTPTLKESLSHIIGEVDSSVKNMKNIFSGLVTNLQTWKMNSVATFSSTSSGKMLESSAEVVGGNVSNFGRSVQSWKTTAVTAVSSSVSGVVKDYNTLCRNVEKNVQTLRSGGAGQINALSTVSASSATSASSSMVPLPASKRDILAGIASPQEDKQRIIPESLEPHLTSSPPLYSISSDSSSSSLQDIFEETAHQDQSSVSATSVFSIGYVGPPLMRPMEPAQLSRAEEVASSLKMLDGPEMGLSPQIRPAPVLEDVRRSIGRALIIYKKIRSLGFRESSWENKMPWRNPRPAFLAKGLQWPQERFSSVQERKDYHKRARRRGRYLIGPTPGWSWFAADVILLYFLINPPAGKFSI